MRDWGGVNCHSQAHQGVVLEKWFTRANHKLCPVSSGGSYDKCRWRLASNGGANDCSSDWAFDWDLDFSFDIGMMLMIATKMRLVLTRPPCVCCPPFWPTLISPVNVIQLTTQSPSAIKSPPLQFNFEFHIFNHTHLGFWLKATTLSMLMSRDSIPFRFGYGLPITTGDSVRVGLRWASHG